MEHTWHTVFPVVIIVEEDFVVANHRIQDERFGVRPRRVRRRTRTVVFPALGLKTYLVRTV
jgi:hypothetical protein